ncbi:dihydropyrimidinase [Paenirhodobacter populi]|uniref:D-hydantoinase n=1 Tax=Paenirhodobacter populi TaxID=2306993 RepID=A0A443JLI6_9RHOB|nr:dihydropyrimidinase [Sinirhodobacter populi]RWR21428.1 dihydropyrimidinase [Sinirhodobacter populi]
MAEFDTVIHSGTIVTSEGSFAGDLAIRDGRIAAIGEKIAGGAQRIDAGGRLVLPGGIESHCHIAQESSSGIMTADDYRSGSVSAAFGGNSSFIPFAAQHRGQSIRHVLDTYGERAKSSVIDYGWHLIVSDPSDEVLTKGLPEAFEAGVTSFKVFTTYDLLNLGDAEMLRILSVAKKYGAITMVHSENNAMIKWMNARLAEDGHTAPRYHAVSRPELAEEEAIHRMISLAKLVDAALFVVHVSTRGGAELVARARAEGAKVFAETCPQYLSLTRDDLDRPGQEGAAYICSPPVRDADTQEALWSHIRRGTFDCITSDHAPYRMDATGKFVNGADAPYTKMGSGMPGIAMRLPYLFSEGVVKGRITLNDFVRFSAANPARLFGMTRKGRLHPGLDADIAIWNPELTKRATLADMHDNMDYTPFEGMEITGWPESVLTRGAWVIRDRALVAQEGQGRFVARALPDLGAAPGWNAIETDPSRNFGARIRP